MSSSSSGSSSSSSSFSLSSLLSFIYESSPSPSSCWLLVILIVLLVLLSNGGITNHSILLLEQYLVPTYTTCVLLYLVAVALRPHLVDYYCWKRLLASGDDDDHQKQQLRRKRTRQLRSLSTTATRPLEQEEEYDDDKQGLSLSSAQKQEQNQQQPIDLSGAYKLVSNNNFESFLAVQGLPWALRRAANAARPVHRITHVGYQITIKIEGIIESQTSYTIHGPPVETNVRGRIFRDAVSYLTRAAILQNDVNFTNGTAPAGTEKENSNFTNNSNNNNNSCHDENGNGSISHDNEIVGIVVHKEALAENYTITVQRQLLNNCQEIIMTSTVFFRDGREPVRCIQQFQRVQEEQ